MKSNNKTRMVAARVSPAVASRLDKVLADPFAPSLTKLVERGLELALREIERRKKRPSTAGATVSQN